MTGVRIFGLSGASLRSCTPSRRASHPAKGVGKCTHRCITSIPPATSWGVWQASNSRCSSLFPAPRQPAALSVGEATPALVCRRELPTPRYATHGPPADSCSRRYSVMSSQVTCMSLARRWGWVVLGFGFPRLTRGACSGQLIHQLGVYRRRIRPHQRLESCTVPSSSVRAPALGRLPTALGCHEYVCTAEREVRTLIDALLARKPRGVPPLGLLALCVLRGAERAHRWRCPGGTSGRSGRNPRCHLAQRRSPQRHLQVCRARPATAELMDESLYDEFGASTYSRTIIPLTAHSRRAARSDRARDRSETA
jgi:hypothetical protein